MWLYRICICLKKIAILYVEFTKKNHFLSFHSSIFDLKIHKHPACKMNRHEQGGAGRKSEVLNKHTFLMTPKSFCWN